MSVLGMMFSVIVSAADAPVQFESCEFSDRADSYIYCDATNLGDVAIGKFQTKSISKDTGRTIAWGQDERPRQVEIAGGIEPKETVRVTLLIPKIPGRANRETLVVEITEITAYGADGDPLN